MTSTSCGSICSHLDSTACGCAFMHLLMTYTSCGLPAVNCQTGLTCQAALPPLQLKLRDDIKRAVHSKMHLHKRHQQVTPSCCPCPVCGEKVNLSVNVMSAAPVARVVLPDSRCNMTHALHQTYGFCSSLECLFCMMPHLHRCVVSHRHCS